MRALAILAVTLLLAACSAKEGVEAHDAWIRVPPPDAMSLGGYMELRNHGPDAVTLTGVRSADFGHIMLHDTVIEDGVARMVHADEVSIGPGETAVFEPGGRHLMLMGPQREFAEGDSVELVLEFVDGTELALSAPVSNR